MFLATEFRLLTHSVCRLWSIEFWLDASKRKTDTRSKENRPGTTFLQYFTPTHAQRDTHTHTGRQETFQFVFYMAKLENKKRKLSFSIFRRRRRRKCLCKFWNATNWKSFSCSTCRRLPSPRSLSFTRKFSQCVRNIKFKKIAAGKGGWRKCCWGRTSSAAAHTHTHTQYTAQ